ncbi:hypothetical protein [Acinetobacter bereziniae]|uniref:hypothetical protein n=1 Tax=Acinetobacter bereziniae TaxID=106648 RepID=UPI00124FA729|nr:hypothetical protein [Acinetobacter bereziniae]
MLDLNKSRKVPDDFVEYAEKQIRHLLNAVSGVEFVMLCTSDGFEIALVNKKNINNSGKIAAVSSSILAMVTAFVSEMALLHKDLKGKAPLIEPNLRRNLGKWST